MCSMLPSQTVENYLKTIYLAHAALPAGALVPMGHVASALGVVPGTATTMVKALTESGLVHYEPYMGVRLTAAGDKLASRVLRRHRLIELFLVKVLGMSWADVHDDAERLEHAVSDPVVERIDQMLGRPSVDPHGDPIPASDGTMPPFDSLDLLTAPIGRALVVTRVLDQSAEFLRFVERRGLVPGSRVVIDARDAQADAIRLRAGVRKPTVVGAGAGAKVLVRVGSRGSTGSTGSKGSKGSKGSTGSTGSGGSRGSRGSKGSRGLSRAGD